MKNCAGVRETWEHFTLIVSWLFHIAVCKTVRIAASDIAMDPRPLVSIHFLKERNNGRFLFNF
jgi:hypothetical protein